MTGRTELIRHEDRKQVQWKNGAGATEEIAVDDAPMSRWRVSIADLGDAATEFSAFEGRSRVFTVIGEWGVTFEWIDGRTTIKPLQPFSFDGEKTPTCLPEGATSAFNVMVDRHTTTASVRVHDLLEAAVHTHPQAVTVVYVHHGSASVGSHIAATGECIATHLESIEIHGAGTVLIAEILFLPDPA
jgi:environmental stress-induced protein Ves